MGEIYLFYLEETGEIGLTAIKNGKEVTEMMSKEAFDTVIPKLCNILSDDNTIQEWKKLTPIKENFEKNSTSKKYIQELNEIRNKLLQKE